MTLLLLMNPILMSLISTHAGVPEEEGLSPIIILIPVVLVVVIIGMIVCGIFINRRWNSKAKCQGMSITRGNTSNVWFTHNHKKKKNNQKAENIHVINISHSSPVDKVEVLVNERKSRPELRTFTFFWFSESTWQFFSPISLTQNNQSSLFPLFIERQQLEYFPPKIKLLFIRTVDFFVKRLDEFCVFG